MSTTASENIHTSPIVIFFDDVRCSAFEPLTLTRTVDQLLIGATTIHNRWLRSLGVPNGFHIQSLTTSPAPPIPSTLAGSSTASGTPQPSSGPPANPSPSPHTAQPISSTLTDLSLAQATEAICINSRFMQVIPDNICATIEPNTKLVTKDAIVLCRLDNTLLQRMLRGDALQSLPFRSIDIGAIRQINEHGIIPVPDALAGIDPHINHTLVELTNIQDLIAVNHHYIAQDYEYAIASQSTNPPVAAIPHLAKPHETEKQVAKSSTTLSHAFTSQHPTTSSLPDQCYIHPTAVIESNATIITTDGAVIIDEHATIRSGAVIRGPVSIGAHTLIQSHAHIYGGTSIGAHCKVGGELSNTIIHDYSNKVHDGFIGNSIIGQWCNLGAGTTCSNLKVTYSPIAVANGATPTNRSNRKLRQFFGIVMADHAKTAIGCMIACGTIIGVCTNLLSSQPRLRYFPSFRWVTANGEEVHQLSKALQTAEVVMRRRNVTMSAQHRALLLRIFNHAIATYSSEE